MPEEQAGEEVDAGSELSAGDISSLKGELDGLKGTVEELKATNTDLTAKLKATEDELLGNDYLEFRESKSVSKPASEKGVDELDYDAMSSRELVAHLKNVTASEREKIIDDFRGYQEQQQEALGTALAKVDLKLTMLENPDMKGKLEDPKYKERFYTAAKDNPTWGAQQCYEYLDALDQRASIMAQKAEKERAAKELAAQTEKGGTPSTAVQGKKMSPEEAFDAAYKATVGTVDTELADDEIR